MTRGNASLTIISNVTEHQARNLTNRDDKCGNAVITDSGMTCECAIEQNERVANLFDAGLIYGRALIEKRCYS